MFSIYTHAHVLSGNNAEKKRHGKPHLKYHVYTAAVVVYNCACESVCDVCVHPRGSHKGTETKGSPLRGNN